MDRRDALQALYGAPLAEFVAERKRLAGGLRAAGEEAAAKEVAARRRPTASAWAVNQLYWHARDPFDVLLATAGRLRRGELDAVRAHRDALADLRRRAAAILQEGGHAASPATLQRVTGTLSAIAAAGGFEPDEPGALSADRAPPGFDAFVPSPAGSTPRREVPATRDTARRPDAGERARRTAAQAEERARRQAEAKAREAERARLATALRDARDEVRERERALAALRRDLERAQESLEAARATVRELEGALATLGARE